MKTDKWYLDAVDVARFAELGFSVCLGPIHETRSAWELVAYVYEEVAEEYFAARRVIAGTKND